MAAGAANGGAVMPSLHRHRLKRWGMATAIGAARAAKVGANGAAMVVDVAAGAMMVARGKVRARAQ